MKRNTEELQTCRILPKIERNIVWALMITAVNENLAQIKDILAKYPEGRSSLIPILQDIQEEYDYLPRESLEQVSKTLDVPFSQLYIIAMFFKTLHLTPRGRHLINVCMGIACHVCGAVKVLEAMGRELGIKSGGATDGLKKPVVLDQEKCIKCGGCYDVCKLGAV